MLLDNVGGTILETLLPNVAARGRVAICGRISGSGKIDSTMVLVRQLTIRGFIVPQSAFAPARKELAELIASGHVKYHVTIADGLDNALSAFLRLFEKGSDHFGKQLVRIA